MKDDPWIAANSPIEPQALHALGVIQYRWNACELGMRLVLCGLEGRKFTETWADYYDSRPKALTDRIRKLAVSRSLLSDKARELVLHAVELYNVNRINRNQLSHFLASARRGGGIDLRNNKTPDYLAIFDGPAVPSAIGDIRQVAEEITALMRFLNALAPELGAHNFLWPSPLPEKPPLPESRWKPPPP